MKQYQLTCLISPDLSEKEADELSAKVVSFIQEQGGALGQPAKLSKKKLGSPIKNENAAYMSVLDFQIEPEKIIAIEKKLKEEQKILRYLISKAVTRKISAEKKSFRKPLKKEGLAVPKLEKKSGSAKKVELKEIEKKLDEILEV